MTASMLAALSNSAMWSFFVLGLDDRPVQGLVDICHLNPVGISEFLQKSLAFKIVMLGFNMEITWCQLPGLSVTELLCKDEQFFAALCLILYSMFEHPDEQLIF